MLKVGLLAAAVLSAAGLSSAHAVPYTATLQEVGHDVVATGGGQIDLRGLTFFESSIGVASEIEPSNSLFFIGAFPAPVDIYSGISGPTSFGSGGPPAATSGTGPFVGVAGGVGGVLVPSGYVSDALLAPSTSLFADATFASMGVIPGEYVWTWGEGQDQRFILDIGATVSKTPLPAALPLFAGGLGVLGFVARRRKRMAASA